MAIWRGIEINVTHELSNETHFMSIKTKINLISF